MHLINALKHMIKLAILASGSGSNAENIVNYLSNNKRIIVDSIISNKPDAYVHERAKKLGIESFTFSKSDFAETGKVLDFIRERGTDFIILAGFLLKIPKNLIDAFPDKIVNIHPALLPKFGGKGMYGDNVHKAVVASGERESGITVHYVNENYDEGNIIFQARCPVLPTDTYENVAAKVHELEYEHFPRVIVEVLQNTK